MKKIKIAEPCHENWNDFTTTQRGAFCGKCQINVIDFSQKSNEQIKDILVANSGKHMCGRFSKSQLDDFNSDYHLWLHQTQNTFQSKFIFALVLVFGLTLFSCSNESEAVVINQITTTLSNGSVNHTDIDTTNSSNITETNIEIEPISCETGFEMGDLMIDEPMEMTMGEMPIQNYEEEIMTKGKVAIETEKEPIITIHEQHPMMLGMVAYFEEPEIMPTELVDTVMNTSSDNNVVISLTDKFEANLYPNPTKNGATLDIDILVKENYEVNVYDSQGRLVKSVFSGMLESGSKSFKLNMNSHENGIYYVQIVTDTQNESLKIIKTN